MNPRIIDNGNYPSFADLPFIFGEEWVILQHLGGGSYSNYQWPPGMAAVTLQFSWYKIRPLNLTYFPNPTANGRSRSGSFWKRGMLYGSHELVLEEQVYTVRSPGQSTSLDILTKLHSLKTFIAA